MKSTPFTMTLSLGALCIFAGAALALVNEITAGPIEQAQIKARAEAIARILPPFDSEIAESEAAGMPIFTATMGGDPVGAAVQTYTDNGFSGRFTLLVGFDITGAVTGYSVLSHAETPGLGARMDSWFMTAPHDICRTTTPLAVRADGGDIDAITGATITSRAFLEAVNRAREAFNEYSANTKS